MNPEDRLNHDLESAVDRVVAAMVAEDNINAAKIIRDKRWDLVHIILQELRLRWTIVERPRQQRTLRQRS